MNKFFYSPTKKQSLLCLLLVLGFVFYAYLPILQAKFLHWNDYAYLVDNPQVRLFSIKNIKLFFISKTQNEYVPLTTLSWALEYRLFNLKAFVYHLDNLLLHLAVVVMIYLTARQMGLSILAASFSSLLFGIHPLHVESVAWIVQRTDVLYGFFYILALFVYISHLKQYLPASVKNPIKVNRYLILTVLFGFLSMLSSPMAFSLPLILLLFDWFKGRRLDIRSFVEKVPLLLASGACLWMNFAWPWRGSIENINNALLIWPWTFVFYIKQFILPLVLVPIYRLPDPVNLSNAEYMFSCIIFAVLFGAFIYFRRYKWFVFAILYYLFSICLHLQFNMSSDVNIVSDRFMYLPSLGICLLLGYAFDRLVNLGRASRFIFYKILPMVCLVILFSWFGVKTYQQTIIWQDDTSLWSYQLKNNPQEYLALTHLAFAMMDKPKNQEAIKKFQEIRSLNLDRKEIKDIEGFNDMFKRVDWIESLFKRSVHINPKQVDAHYNLGSFYETIGLDKKALFHYLMSASIAPKYRDVFLRIGRLNARNNYPQKAILAFDQALKFQGEDENTYINVILFYRDMLYLSPDNKKYTNALHAVLDRFVKFVNSKDISETSYYNLGYVYEMLGMHEEAIRSYQMVIDHNAAHINAYFHSGLSMRKQRKYVQALDRYDKAIALNGRRLDILFEKANLLAKIQKIAEAIEVYESILKIDDQSIDVLFNLGYLYEGKGKLSKAKENYEKAVAAGAQRAGIYYNLGNVYAALKDYPKAHDVYLKAADIDKNHKDAWINLTLLSFQLGHIKQAYEYYKETQLLGYNAPEGLMKGFEEAGLMGGEK